MEKISSILKRISIVMVFCFILYLFVKIVQLIYGVEKTPLIVLHVFWIICKIALGAFVLLSIVYVMDLLASSKKLREIILKEVDFLNLYFEDYVEKKDLLINSLGDRSYFFNTSNNEESNELYNRLINIKKDISCSSEDREIATELIDIISGNKKHYRITKFFDKYFINPSLWFYGLK